MTPHPEAEALLNAIYDHPDDDTPRLVYADWLQEHGQENYAQFIRLQCAAAREQLWSAEANRLWEEIGRVWNRLYYEWLPAMHASWPQRGTDNLDAIHFHRGFLKPNVRVTTTLLAFVNHVWDWFPTREVVATLTELGAALELLATDPRMQRVRYIETASWLGLAFERGPEDAAILDEFLRSPHLCNLKHFDLGSHWVKKSTLAVLLSVNSIPRATELIVSFLPADSYEEGSEYAELLPDTVAQLRERFPNVVIVND
jgi:uncharacterized protein (TIGR02996 family)